MITNNSILSERKRILFIGEGISLAHLLRPLALARSLDPKLFDVHFACAEGNDFIFAGTNLRRWPLWSMGSERFFKNLLMGKPVFDYPTLSRYIEDDYQLLSQIKPDLVVGDFRLSLSVSAALCKIPFATITNAHWSPYAIKTRVPVPEHPLTRIIGYRLAQAVFPLWQSMLFAEQTAIVNKVRHRYGFSNLKNLYHIYTESDCTLYADIPSLIPTQALPANHHFIGGISWFPEIPHTIEWWDAAANHEPTIYVNLGSSGDIAVLPEVIRALSSFDGTVMVATAGRLQLPTLPGNVRTAQYLPGKQAAARSQLVICNGGSASVYQALQQGRPLLGIVSNLDQHLCMEAVARAGAGILLRADQATAKSIHEATTKLLADESYKFAAQRLANEMIQFDPADRFLVMANNLLAERSERPVQEPALALYSHPPLRH